MDRTRIAPLWLGVLMAASSARAEPPAVFDLRAGGEVIGDETIVATASGWSFAGRRTYAGGAWWNYEGTVSRSETGGWSWRVDSSTREGGTWVTATAADGTLETSLAGAPIELPRDRFTFPFDRRAIYGFVILARELTDRFMRESFTVGERCTAALALPPEGASVELIAAASFRHEREARVEAIRRFTVEFEGGEAGLLCSKDGDLLGVDAPFLGLFATRRGFDDAPLPLVRSTRIDDGPWRRALSPARFRILEEKNQRVAMRDGVHLATDVYRPQATGRFPTILVRTPYFRLTEGPVRSPVFVPRGYAVVVQDVRGRGASEGSFEPLVREEEDGSDTLDWIAAQPWSDGVVGMIGASYVGWTQMYAAKSGNLHLRAMVPIVCPPDPDENFPYEGGVPMLLVGWWAAVMDAMDEDGILAGIPPLDWDEALAVLPIGDVDDALETSHAFVDEWFRHGPDHPYWDPIRFHPSFDAFDVPALHVSGWFDGDQPGALLNFAALRRRSRTAEARHGQYLMMGPWGHGVNLSRRLGRHDLGDEAIIDLDAVCLRFFDRYLKGIPNGIDEEDPVMLFTLGENRWRRTSEWPPPDVASVPVYLSSRGGANRRDGDGRLDSTARPDDGSADTYRYDPLDPRPLEVDFADMIGSSALIDQSALPDRDDVLDYRSSPLAGTVTITGPISVRLFVATDALDTDFAVELFRVTPSGEMIQIAGGIQRLRYRTGRDEPVPPGTVVEVVIDAWATSIRLAQGERLHLQVSSSQFPVYARNLNTLEPPVAARDAVVATNQVFHSHVRPSRVVLPVVGGADALRFEALTGR